MRSYKIENFIENLASRGGRDFSCHQNDFGPAAREEESVWGGPQPEGGWEGNFDPDMPPFMRIGMLNRDAAVQRARVREPVGAGLHDHHAVEHDYLDQVLAREPQVTGCQDPSLHRPRGRPILEDHVQVPFPAVREAAGRG